MNYIRESCLVLRYRRRQCFSTVAQQKKSVVDNYKLNQDIMVIIAIATGIVSDVRRR